MKNITKIILIVPLLLVLSIASFAQFPPQDSIVYDSEGNPWYLKNQMIIKFHPDLVNLNVVDDPNKLVGTVEEFINPIALQMLIDSGYFNEGLAYLTIKKVYPWLSSNITTSETRIGTTIEMPKFWAVFLVYWDSYATGVTFNEALDTLNNLWPAVEYAEPNYIGNLHVLPNDALFVAGEQPGLHPTATFPNCNININPAWDLTVGRDNTRVGIFDTGINWDHEDFSQDNSGTFPQSRIKGGQDFINSTTISTNTTLDAHGHGSSCAGIVGAIRNNDRGVAGIAGGNGAINSFGADLFVMKISQIGFIDQATAASAISQGATSIGSGGFGLHVTNHSYGFTSSSNTLKDAVRFAFRNNCILSVSSGNDGNQTVNYPATYRDEWVLKVGANDQTGNRVGFSTFGNSLDFIAPGTGNIYATTDAASNTTYTFNGDGTSFSAPHATGVAALMTSYINSPSNAPNNLAPEDVENLMQRFATDITVSPASVGYDDHTGFGRIDAGATLQGIRWPRFEVRHYSTSIANSNNTKISSNVQLVLPNSHNGVAAGTYIGDVYRVTANLNITQPSGRNVIDVWNRNSSSVLWGGNNPIVTEINSPLISWNQTSAEMRGFIFNIKTTITGGLVNRWFPNDLNGSSNFALTVYSEDPLASNIKEMPIDKNFARAIPNPSNGNFTLMFTLLKNTELGVEVTDLTGRIVYSKPMKKTNSGHQEIELTLQNLKGGIYLCTIVTPQGKISQKISILK